MLHILCFILLTLFLVTVAFSVLVTTDKVLFAISFGEMYRIKYSSKCSLSNNFNVALKQRMMQDNSSNKMILLM